MIHVLVLADDYWHPVSTVREGLAPLAEKGYSFDWIVDGSEWSAEKMADYPVVILSKSNNTTQEDKSPWVTPEVEQAFADYVRGGGGLLVTHSGTVFRDTETLRPLMGGAFVQHPPQCDVTHEPKAGHGLTAGVASFTVQDEHYHMVLEPETTDVFMTTTSEHSTQPGGWTRLEGTGRVAVLTPGHNVDVWLVPAYQTLLDNVLRWCAGARA
jgi:type 1 glutamine amidotransferase